MTKQNWSLPDEYLLATLRAQGWSYEKIAEHMGRTVDSVRNKAHKMDRKREGKKPYPKNRGAAIRSADSTVLADELIRRGWRCFAPRRESVADGQAGDRV